tara:strand:- start:4719 stop:4868 length:150 start_codon:yes stop_codon:yes gene_type:complete
MIETLVEIVRKISVKDEMNVSTRSESLRKLNLVLWLISLKISPRLLCGE